jgi:hypothetical protein
VIGFMRIAVWQAVGGRMGHEMYGEHWELVALVVGGSLVGRGAVGLASPDRCFRSSCGGSARIRRLRRRRSSPRWST